MKKYILIMTALLWLPHGAMARDDIPLMYSRANIIVSRHNVPAPPPPDLPWQTLPAPDPNIIFDVEIRDAAVLYNQQGWFELSSLSEKSGIMMVFSAPGIAPISRNSNYASLDILFVDAEGNIAQIIPSITLARLNQDIMPAVPVRAFLFLKGGTCAATGIAPGDVVQHSIFVPPPTILGTAGIRAPSPAPAQVVQPMQGKKETPPAPSSPQQLLVPVLFEPSNSPIQY